MKRITITVLALMAIGIATMVSCKKKSDPSPKDNLVGTWKISKQYQDTNRNGVMDANELMTLDTANDHQTIKFTADGWVTLNYYSFAISNKWEFANSNTYLKITDTSSMSTPSYSQILTLTSSAMTLKDTTNASLGGASWTYFTKQ